MSAAPEVTVVLPTRNRAAMLDGALRAALGQIGVTLEVVVVDEASTDDTGEVLRRRADSRLRIIHHSSPNGVAAARNEAIREARGTWIAFLDDDDLWAPGWLRAAMDAGAEKDLVYGARWVIDAGRRAFGVGLAEHPDRIPALLRRYNAIGGPSGVVVRKEIAENAGGFDERLSALADWEAWLRFATQGRVAAVPELLVGYTTYTENMHQRDPYGVLNEFHRLVQIMAARDETDVPPEALFRRWLAFDVEQLGRRRTAARLYVRSGRGPGTLNAIVRALLGKPPALERPLAQPGWLAPFVLCPSSAAHVRVRETQT